MTRPAGPKPIVHDPGAYQRERFEHDRIFGRVGELHHICPLPACKRHGTCQGRMNQRLSADIRATIPGDARARIDTGMLPCVAMFAHLFHAGNARARAVMDGLKLYGASLDFSQARD